MQKDYIRILVIPDIHLKPWLFDCAENILESGKADRAVCLMDMPDDWDMQFQIGLYAKTFDRAIKFAKDHPDTLWCYGNHDLSYPWGMLETGYSPYAERTVMAKLDELINSLPDPSQIAFIHRVGNVLFSHGGLTADFIRRLNEEFLEDDIDEILEMVNGVPPKYMWNDDSPLWLRPQYRDVEAFRKDTYLQVIGHTPVEEINLRNGFLSTDVFSRRSDGSQIGESAMAVIDTVTKEYEKVEVKRKHYEPY